MPDARQIAEQIRVRLSETLKDINQHLGPSWPPNGFGGERVHDYAVAIELALSELQSLSQATATAEAEATRERTARVNTGLLMAQKVATAEAERDEARKAWREEHELAKRIAIRLAEAIERGKIGGSLGCCEHPRDPDQNAR